MKKALEKIGDVSAFAFGVMLAFFLCINFLVGTWGLVQYKNYKETLYLLGEANDINERCINQIKTLLNLSEGDSMFRLEGDGIIYVVKKNPQVAQK